MMDLCNRSKKDEGIKDFDLSQVTIKDSYQVNVLNKEIDYLTAVQ